MKPRYVLSTGNSDLDAYLVWRRKTRLLRKYGGPMLAIVMLIIACTLIWQMSHPRFDVQPESVIATGSP